VTKIDFLDDTNYRIIINAFK